MKNMYFTDKPPDKEGFYWYTNFGEHTPTVLRVKRDYSTNSLWASDEEFYFEIKPKLTKELDFITEEDYVDKPFKYGDELWCYIPNPILPTGKVVKPDSY